MSLDYLFWRTENQEQINTPLTTAADELKENLEAVENFKGSHQEKQTFALGTGKSRINRHSKSYFAG